MLCNLFFTYLLIVLYDHLIQDICKENMPTQRNDKTFKCISLYTCIERNPSLPRENHLYPGDLILIPVQPNKNLLRLVAVPNLHEKQWWLVQEWQ